MNEVIYNKCCVEMMLNVRIRLKNFLLLVTVLIVASSFSFWIWRGRSQQLVVSELEGNGGVVFYDYQLDKSGAFTYQAYPTGIPRQLVLWFGDDYFSNVHKIQLNYADRVRLLELQPVNSTRILSLSESSVGSVEGIEQFSKLVELEIAPTVLSSGTLQDVDFSFLMSLHLLERLRVRLRDAKSLEYLKNCNQLKEFVLTHNSDMNFELHFNKWGYFGAVHEPYRFRKSTLPAVSLKPLAKKKHLEKVVCYGHRNPNLDPFQGKQFLRHLDISFVANADLLSLRDSSKLETLVLSHSKIQNIHQLKNFPYLKRFALRSCRFSWPEKPVTLPDGLEELILENVNLDSLTQLSLPQSLKRIRISGSNISELSALKKLKQLKQIVLTRNSKLNAKGLYGMKQLEKLTVGKYVSDEEIQRLKKSIEHLIIR